MLRNYQAVCDWVFIDALHPLDEQEGGHAHARIQRRRVMVSTGAAALEERHKKTQSSKTFKRRTPSEACTVSESIRTE